jgi:DNA-binding response OmpR family regulator
LRILIVEDEPDLAQAIAVGLRREGYAVDLAPTGGDALDKLAVSAYDLICLDLNLPDMDGLEVCRSIRAGDGLPGEGPRVLMLTARDSLDDRVAGLDDGADDYLVKPFAFPELLARLRALSRRDVASSGARLEVGGLALDAAKRDAWYRNQALDLTAKEFALLRYFMLHSGEVLSAERLLEHVWDEHADPFTNTVRVTISNLRRKLRETGAEDVIDTVVGSGYRLVDMP